MNTERLILEKIGKLPRELINLIGSYSHHVRNQKSLIRIEFYDKWFLNNKIRIVSLLKGWTKAKLAFALNNIKWPNNPYYDCCFRGTLEYRRGTALMFKSRIETLIREIGQLSNAKQYSLLLAIEKCDKRRLL